MSSQDEFIQVIQASFLIQACHG